MANKTVKPTEKNTQTRKPVRKKKRRLRKQVRYALIGLGLLAIVLVVFLIARLFSPSDSQENPSQTTVETSSSALDPKIYPYEDKTVATLLIDPGHGGYDPGNLSEDPDDKTDYVYEKDINLEVALKVKSELERINPNIKVLLTRDSDDVDWPMDEVEDLTARVDLQEETEADYFLSLHCNADYDSSTKGFVFFMRTNDTLSMDIAKSMEKNFEEIGWSELHSIRTGELLQVVTNAKIPSILLEMGFMSNSSDLNLLVDQEMTDKLAIAIAASYSDFIMAHQDLNPSEDAKVLRAQEAKKKAQEEKEKEQENADNASTDSSDSTQSGSGSSSNSYTYNQNSTDSNTSQSSTDSSSSYGQGVYSAQ